MSAPESDPAKPLPEVDERLVAPESRHEIIDGRVVYVSPCDEPHGTRHAQVAALLAAHVSDAFNVAIDMLTRTSRLDDIAPDVSVFPRARNPNTGGRLLEHLAFEIVATEHLGHAGTKAAKLLDRGVRRVFAVDVDRGRALTWSRTTDAWEILPRDGTITDETLAVPLPLSALVEAVRSDEPIARALVARKHPVIEAARQASSAEGRAEGRAEALLVVLRSRGLLVPSDVAEHILRTRDPGLVDRWLARAGTCATVEDLLAE